MGLAARSEFISVQVRLQSSLDALCVCSGLSFQSMQAEFPEYCVGCAVPAPSAWKSPQHLSPFLLGTVMS